MEGSFQLRSCMAATWVRRRPAMEGRTPGEPGCAHASAASGGRIGEAANPGPAQVVSANCTSIKGATGQRNWEKLTSIKPDLLILQEVRCSVSELAEMARKAGCQVVYGEELEGMVLVAAFAWTGALQKISRSPTGLSHHFQRKIGGQSLHVRNGYFQGATAQELLPVSSTSGLSKPSWRASPC